jgi:hypothetical protein
MKHLKLGGGGGIGGGGVPMMVPGGMYQADQFKDPPDGVLVNNRFVIKAKVGKGSFGCVFKGNILSDDNRLWL